MDLVETVSEAKQVIFIDARADGLAGEIKTEIIHANTSLDSPASHFFDPQTLLAAVQALYGSHPPASLVTISAASFEYGAPLSTPVAQAVNRLVDELALKGSMLLPLSG
jgi:hydrogenase maturation protease